MISEKDEAIALMDEIIETSFRNEGSIKPHANTKHIIRNSEPIPAIKQWIKKTFIAHQQVFFICKPCYVE